MPSIGIDFETRSTLDLKKVGAYRYAGDPTTEVLACAAFALDDGPIELWTPDQPIPEAIARGVAEGWIFRAFNAAFEMVIWRRILAERRGWPEPKLEQWRCSMAMALANALPGSLDGAAAALELPGKSKDGERLMKQMSRPRKPRKGDDPTMVQWLDDPERRDRLHAYCKRDVEIERALYQRLPPLSESEQKLWQLDAQINRRGFAVDVKPATAARELSTATLVEINRALAELTDGRVTSVSQVARIEALVKERGHKIQSLGKRNVAAVLAHTRRRDRAAVALRQEGGKASAEKLDTLLASANNGRCTAPCGYHRAATGRWSGSGFPAAQSRPRPAGRSMPRSPPCCPASSNACRDRPAAGAVGSLSRSMIIAAPGHDLIGGDFSGIERRA